MCIFAFIGLSKNRGNRHSISHKIYIFICSKPGFHNSCFRDNISITFCITQLLQITVSSNINCFTQKKKKEEKERRVLASEANISPILKQLPVLAKKTAQALHARLQIAVCRQYSKNSYQRQTWMTFCMPRYSSFSVSVPSGVTKVHPKAARKNVWTAEK